MSSEKRAMIGNRLAIKLGHTRSSKSRKLVYGIMNNWGGKTVVFLVDSFSLEGEGVKPMAVDSAKKLATAWAELKH